MNTEASFTVGEWKLYDPDKETRSFGVPDRRILVLHPDGERIIAHCATGVVSRGRVIPKEEILANARLIVQSPKMYDMLNRVSRIMLDRYDDWRGDEEAEELFVGITGVLQAAHEDL